MSNRLNLKIKQQTDEASGRAEEGILRVLLLESELSRRVSLPPPEDFTVPELRHIYTELLARLERGGDFSTAALGSVLSSEEMSLLVRLQNEPLTAANSERALRDYIAKLYECKELQKKPAADEDLLALQQQLRERKGY